MGHRVVGHEGKCRHLHGHNYVFTFVVMPDAGLDEVGRVMDFSVIKEKLCMWLERHWDHKFIAWSEDLVIDAIDSIETSAKLASITHGVEEMKAFELSFVRVPFNPTAENIARYMVDVIGPKVLNDTGCTLIECKVQETTKCSATARKE